VDGLVADAVFSAVGSLGDRSASVLTRLFATRVAGPASPRRAGTLVGSAPGRAWCAGRRERPRLCHRGRTLHPPAAGLPRWVHVRTVSKSLGTDLRRAAAACDATTSARHDGRLLL